MFTHEDRAFIRTILANPAELTSWLVYADWLDEHDNPDHAEFLRLEVRRGQLRNTDAEWPTVEARLKELRGVVDRNWVAVFDRPDIENCQFAFEFKCPKKWESLTVLDRPSVRHCPACEKDVHYCHTLPEAQAHARSGHCVAVQLDVKRYPNDLEPILTESVVTMGMIAYPEPEPPQPVARRPWWKFW